MKKVIMAIILIVILAGIVILVNQTKSTAPHEVQNNNTVENNNINEEETNPKEDESNKEIANTPVGIHGKLSVKETNIVDKNGEIIQLKGISTHGLQWFPQYVNKDTFKFMRDEWGINVIRLAMYTDPNVGYTKELHNKVKEGINYATELGLYVIVDWHILSDGNPNTYKSQAIEFFKEITNEYKDNENIMYEICNEPNGNVTWVRDIKPYAEDVIKEIREIDKDSIIICGTPTWSQDIDVVAKDRIEGYDNIMYSLHFYAATHTDWLRNRAKQAIDSKLPIFVSEFGICDASGNGGIDYNQSEEWIKFLNENNISWVMWNLSNKQETSAIINSNCNKTTSWTLDELSAAGKWFVEVLKK